jgi:hypothetical protein
MKNIRFIPVVLLCVGLVAAVACSSGQSVSDVSDGHVSSDSGDVVSGDVADSVSGDVSDVVQADVVGDVADVTTPSDVVNDAETLQPDPLAVTHFFPPVTAAGSSIALNFAATGGKPPYSNWKVIKGELPSGTALDADTGAWTGTPTVEGFYYFVVEVTDSDSATGADVFGIRVGEPAADGALYTKALGYQAVYEARHDWNGFSFNNMTPDDPDGNFGLSTLGDAAFQSGQCTMAMAYREAVLRTDESAAYLKRQVDGWRFFQRLTGVPGLIGRSYGRADDPWEDNHHSDGFWPENPDSRSYVGEGEFADWIWVGDVSRDQATGAVLGMAAAYDLSDDPETKAVAAEFLVQLMDHVWDNNLDFMDKNGQLTKYGNIDGEKFEGFPAPSGLNAACALAWFKIAAHVAESEGMENAERFNERYQELLARDYISIMRDVMWVYGGYATKTYNVYMAFENMFHLARLEKDPIISAEINQVFRDTLWLNLDDNTPNRKGVKEANPVKTAWYLSSTGDKNPVALWEALWQVVVFSDAPLRDRYVKNSDNPDIVINPDQPTESLYPLPSNRLPPDMVIWHRSTFELDGGVDSGEERTGCDYMLPYWMGRYYGWIDGNW